MSKQNLQELLDHLKPHDTLTLDPPNREFKGAIVIHKPVVIRGNGATIHAARGPVLVVQANGVRLANLTIEVDGKDIAPGVEAASALLVQSTTNLTLDDIRVYGDVVGIPGEDGSWQYPRSLSQQNLAIGREHKFNVRLRLPVPCKLTSQIDGLTIGPEKFDGGIAEACLVVEPLKAKTKLRGDIVIRTAHFARWIRVTFNAARPDTKEDKIITGDGQWIYACDTPPATPPSPLVEPPPLVEAPPPIQTPAAVEPSRPGGRRRSQTVRTGGLGGPWSPFVDSKKPLERASPAPALPIGAETPSAKDEVLPSEKPSSKRVWSPRVAGKPESGPWSPTFQAGKSHQDDSPAAAELAKAVDGDVEAQVPAPEEKPYSRRFFSPRVAGTPGGIFSPQARSQKTDEDAESAPTSTAQIDNQASTPDEKPPSTPITPQRVAGKPAMDLWSPTVRSERSIGSENLPSADPGVPLSGDSTQTSTSSTPNASAAAETKTVLSQEPASDIEKEKPARKRKLVQGKTLAIFGNDAATK